MNTLQQQSFLSSCNCTCAGKLAPGRDSLLKCSPLLYFPVVSSCYKESSMATTARHRMVHWCFFHPAPGVSQCPRPFVHCCSGPVMWASRAGGCLSPRCSHVPLDMPDLMPHLHSQRILRVLICFVLRFFFLSARAQDPFLSSATQFCSYFIYFLYSGQLEFMCVHALSKSSWP